MAVEIVTREDLQQFRMQLLEDLRAIFGAEPSRVNDQRPWLRSGEVRALLNISPGTLQTLRISGVLRSCKVGKMHYYKMEDIERLFNGGGVGSLKI